MSGNRTLLDSPIKKDELAVVVGGGVSGLAAAALLRRLGARVRLLDHNPRGFSEDFLTKAAPLDLDLISGPHRPEHFNGSALVIPSPGVAWLSLAPILNQAGDPPCISELELATSFAHEKIIAVTGTSGKTTTVSLIAAMLRTAGKTVFLGGNIGTPLSTYILDRELGAPSADVLVLEVSSFQLQLTRAFHPKVAVLLNLSPNHLDQHKDFAEYEAAKLRIFANQTPRDTAILDEKLFDLAQRYFPRAKVEYFAPSTRFPCTRLAGAHNRANLEAAFLAVREMGVTEQQAAEAVKEFHPLPHRLEQVGERDGILYINDSKGTTVEALRAALQSLDRPAFLLAGGVFKGGDLKSLQTLIQEKIKTVALFGGSREYFERAWQASVPISWDARMEGALRRVKKAAVPGDAVLLSPATSSFDLYKNYQERGNDFKRLVQET